MLQPPTKDSDRRRPPGGGGPAGAGYPGGGNGPGGAGANTPAPQNPLGDKKEEEEEQNQTSGNGGTANNQAAQQQQQQRLHYSNGPHTAVCYNDEPAVGQLLPNCKRSSQGDCFPFTFYFFADGPTKGEC